MVAPNTNLVRYSGQLTNPVWNYGDAVAVRIPPASPTGHAFRFMATGLYSDSLTQFVYQYQIPEFVPNVTFTASVWVLRENWTEGEVYLRLLNDNPTPGQAGGIAQPFFPNGNDAGVSPSFNFGGNAPWSNVIGGVEHLPGSWERIWVQGTSPNTPGSSLNIGVFAPVVGTPPGDIGSSFLIGGFALVQGVDPDFVDTTTAPRGNEFLPVFDFPYHTVETRYPNDGTTVQFGNSYTFTAAASGPPQRSFGLDFATLVYYLDMFTGQVDPTKNPKINLAALDTFYNLVRMSANFHYDHPAFGRLVVRFAKPLVIPKGLMGGSGASAPVAIELVEVP